MQRAQSLLRLVCVHVCIYWCCVVYIFLLFMTSIVCAAAAYSLCQALVLQIPWFYIPPVKLKHFSQSYQCI